MLAFAICWPKENERLACKPISIAHVDTYVSYNVSSSVRRREDIPTAHTMPQSNRISLKSEHISLFDAEDDTD